MIPELPLTGQQNFLLKSSVPKKKTSGSTSTKLMLEDYRPSNIYVIALEFRDLCSVSL